VKKTAALLLHVALAGLLTSCGGSSTPSAPSPGAAGSQTLSAVSGETGGPAAGVRIVAAGVGYTTNASGQVAVPAALTSEATVDFEGTGFLKRETTLARGPQFSLWPTQAQGATEAWTRQVLHGTFGTSSMLRPDPQLRQYTIIPDAAMAADAGAMAAVERAAAMWSAATGSTGFTMRVGSGAPVNGFGVVVATIDSTSPTSGGAAPLGTGRALSGGTITFRSLAVAGLPMAAPNDSLYIFTGLLNDMDDDEVAIILGHELAHATHEHSRKGFKKNMLIQLAALGIAAVAEETVKGKNRKEVIQVAAMLGATAWVSGYGRSHEDQADRVGMRYAYEAGFDVRKGPALWNRFAAKYGDSPKLLNFFFGDHSVAQDRARNLTRELSLNYRR